MPVRSTSLLLAASLTAALVGQLAAQAPQGPPFPTAVESLGADPDPAGPAGLRLSAARSAHAAGNHALALEHGLAALEFHPSSKVILELLLDNSSSDPDAAFLWTLRGAARAKPPAKNERGGFPVSPHDLVAARAAAVAELAQFVAKLKGSSARGNGLLARWASDLALELAHGSPALMAAHGPAFNAACERQQPDYSAVLDALRKIMEHPPQRTGARHEAERAADDLAIRAARCLTGLAAQTGFKKLEGPPPPPLGGIPAAAREARARIRQRVEARAGAPLTVEQLTQMDEAGRQAFTKEHAGYANPGIAVSPSGRYVIETTCGHGTLLAAASTIDLHHARLADWFGKDPFGDRPGRVRIVPESEDLESEDAPFWWAGGFQSGDLTVVRFSWSNAEALGRLLTHELTHRFDGRLFAFMPAWLVEGRAVWTGRAYGKRDDARFADKHLDPWTVQTPFVKGYGGVANLTKLIEGTIDDYRDNYTAGYALFVYLATWVEGGRLRFEERLRSYMRNARGGTKQPLEFFVSHFADGKQGRPEGLEEFAKGFQEFLHGCYRKCWSEPVDWMARYQLGHAKGPADGTSLVLEEPTFSWARSRAEPAFGQSQAARAGRLLAEVGADQAAAAALIWSLRTDGPDPEVGALLARLLEKIGSAPAAFVAWRIAEPAHLAGDRGATLRPCPMLAGLPRLRAWFEAQATAATALREKGLPLASRALALEHNRLAPAVGLAPITVAPMPVPPVTEPAATVPAATGDAGARLFPTREPARNLGLLQWEEDGLTDFEERRVAGHWFEDDELDLHVGRPKPRDKTGILDRTAHQNHAFVRSVGWQPAGDYVLKTRVHFTTSFVSGAVILGYTRRDRNVRVHFSAGDFLYAIGRKEETVKTEKVHVSITGLFERDHQPQQHEARPEHDVELKAPSPHFDLEVRVNGASISVLVQGQHFGNYTTSDGTPIEGHIGFAMGQGAVRLQRPTVQRLDRGNLEPAAPPGLDPRVATARPWKELWRLPVRGIPLAPEGTLVLWLPDTQKDPVDTGLLAAEGLASRLAAPADYPQKWVMAVPVRVPADDRRDLASGLEETSPGRWTVIDHAHGKLFSESAWLLFVDSFGVLRAASPVTKRGEMPGTVDGWARTWRAR